MTDVADRLRVLAVDDEPFTLKALQRLLRAHTVEVASSGNEALQRIGAGEEFDVIVCDVMMPEVTGVDVYRRLAESHPGLEERIVFISGGAFGGEIVAFLKQVPNPMVAKPFDRQELQAVVQRVGQQAR